MIRKSMKSCGCGPKRKKALPRKKKGGTVKDSCYYKAKRAHKVFPSAYASGMIAKCRKNK